MNRVIASWQAFWTVYMLSAMMLYIFSPRIPKFELEVELELLWQLTVNAFASLAFSYVISVWISDVSEVSATTMLCQILVSLALLEIWFYYGHRLVHHRWIYKNVHKKHHKYIEPHSLTGAYCGIIEMLLVNVSAVSIGPILTGMSEIMMVTWMVVISIGTTASHSGLYIPYINSGTHDIHHQRLDKNFGILGILDRLHGTYQAPF